MTLRVCTAVWGDAYQPIGARFAAGFARFWPAEAELVVYSDRPMDLPRGERRNISTVPGLLDFLDRHAGNPRAAGRAPAPDWPPKERAKGWSWRHDALRWAPQAMVPYAASLDLGPSDLLVWLDADVETIAPVPAGWVGQLLDGHDAAYLGRRVPAWSEIGFLAFRLPFAAPLLQLFAVLYRDDGVFHLAQQHSAFVFDEARRRRPEVRARDLTPGGMGHVWPASPLAACTRHDKGKRKFVL